MFQQPANEAAATMPTYHRTLGPNELSYFLPSRADGVNDMCSELHPFQDISSPTRPDRLIIHAPPSLITPLRVRMAWGILRLRHSLMACRVEMQPGCYDEARFALTPPSSPSRALTEAAACVRIFDDVTGPELMCAFMNGPRTLSANHLSRLDFALHGHVSQSTHEFQLIFMLHYMINDTLGVYATEQHMCELLGGSATPGGPPRTDAELAKVLDHEWMQRWGALCVAHDLIVAATEVRILGLSQSKFQEAAWKVDNQNIQKRSIGGHVFLRTKSPAFKMRLIQARFDVSQTKAIFSKCKSNRVTVANAVWGLFNFAWIRLCAAHPEIDAPKDLPVLMYTAISLRRYLTPPSPLESYMSLALDYCNVMLPAFLPADADPYKMFWTRSRHAQRQMFKHAHSPLLLRRAVATGARPAGRALRPGPSPRRRLRSSASRTSATLPRPSSARRRTPLKTVDMDGCAREAPGGMLVVTRTSFGRFRMALMWDAVPFPPGLVEEFWRYVVDGVHEYVLEDASLKGTAEEMDTFANAPLSARSKL
ncbi:hypothetical protein B0H14DRAFT_332534 [Mycena olivaceomarginata]|nr:hypothetical protein B0H14DRAFT_332534 [Mycena olivaceomarginata]